MKKCVVFLVVFALMAGAVFAVDFGAAVFGHVNVIETNGVKDVNDDDSTALNSSGGIDRWRIDASHDGGNFGAYMRMNNGTLECIGWWNPLDLLKMTIGRYSDGMLGKEGWAGWMFYQMPSDCGIVKPDSVWGGGYYNLGWRDAAWYRQAFFGGYEIEGLLVDIVPADILSVHVGFPFFGVDTWDGGGKDFVSDVIGNIMVQANVNLDFGNIALTYWGDETYGTKLEAAPDAEDDPIFSHTGRFFLSTSIGAIENVGLDIGVGFPVPGGDGNKKVVQDPIAVGLGAKVDINDAFGIKVRLLTSFAGQETYDGEVENKTPFFMGADLLPYYAINDNMKVFASLGITMQGNEWDTVAEAEISETDRLGFHFNPYVQIGGEWGPCVYFGVRLWSDNLNKSGAKQTSKGTDYNPINVAVPIGIQISY